MVKRLFAAIMILSLVALFGCGQEEQQPQDVAEVQEQDDITGSIAEADSVTEELDDTAEIDAQIDKINLDDW